MATPVNPADITPRQVANKSDKKALRDAIRMTLGVQSPAVRHNTQTFNRNRYAATALLPDYDELKDRARIAPEPRDEKLRFREHRLAGQEWRLQFAPDAACPGAVRVLGHEEGHDGTRINESSFGRGHDQPERLPRGEGGSLRHRADPVGSRPGRQPGPDR